MSKQLQVPCLGRPFHLGMLYDCRTEKLIPGVTLWNAARLKSTIMTTKQIACESNTFVEDTFQTKSSSLKMEAGTKLSVMSGLIDVEGAAKFLHDRKSSEKQCRVTLQYTSTTHFEQLTMDQLGDMQVLDNMQEATHVVTGLTYGADAFLVFDRSVSEGEALNEISADMEAKISQMSSCAVTAGASGSLKASKRDKTETEKFGCKFYGDFIPKFNPTTFDEALTFCKDLPEILKKGAKPKLANLMPLTQLSERYGRDIHPICLTLVTEVEDIMEYFYHTEVRANDLLGHKLCRKFIDIENQLSMFRKFLLRFKRDFIEKLSKSLQKIRSEGKEAELAELVSSVERSPFSRNKTKEYLEAKNSEIKQLAQLLKNMEQYPKIRYDFPDTQCDLKTLSNDDKLDHIVCFAFNITSGTCDYLETLKSYIEGCGTKPVYNEQDIVNILNSEVEKFENLSSTTEDDKTVYVATSAVRDKASKFIPSIWLYTRKKSPMPLDVPGPPRARSVTIDSITLTWDDPRHENVGSYKVLYRSTKETKFTTLDSRGTVTTRHVNDLMHGVKYEFKIQVTTKSGFKVESESAYIKTTEYYDIVLIGKTGQGKSTLGNKLLNLENTAESKIKLFDHTEGADKKRFAQADDPEFADSTHHSVTTACKLMSNKDTKIRVLDVPGFSDSGSLKKILGKDISVYAGNLLIVRWLVREQIMSQLMVRRIAYFLPARGPLEKADGTMQEELKVLHHYFGKEVFNCIVVVATNNPKVAFQKVGFDDDDYAMAKKVFHTALKEAINDEDIACPPVIYISLLEDNADVALSKIQSASVLQESTLPLLFTDAVCARCSCGIRYDGDKAICIINADGKTAPYANSKCHPLFIPKYSKVQKFFGGLGHIALLGISLLIEMAADIDTWPGFTNSDEECIVCRKFPGSEGCKTVGEKIPVLKDKKEETIEVIHSNKLY